MGDYRYTELSYKITSLISRTCCLGSSYTITTKILSMHFNYLFLLLLISLETTTPHVSRCPFIFAFYLHKFLQLPHQLMVGCIYDRPFYDTLYIIDLQCTISVGAMVSSLIQISTRSATIKKPKGADKG